jgi:hypothetical protein
MDAFERFVGYDGSNPIINIGIVISFMFIGYVIKLISPRAFDIIVYWSRMLLGFLLLIGIGAFIHGKLQNKDKK